MPANFGLLAMNQQTSADADIQLGVEYEVEDLDYSSTYQAPGRPQLSKSMVLVRRVKANTSTLAPSVAVKWASGKAGTEVVICGLADIPVGFVTPYAGTVAINAHCLIVRRGPTTILSDGSSTLAQDDQLVTAATGYVKKQVAAPADATAGLVQVNSRAGRSQATVAATAGIGFRAYVDCTAN